MVLGPSRVVAPPPLIFSNTVYSNSVGRSQNLAEAEYVVAVFMFMRLVGWPARRISILTTYNGQKHLIRDVITKRCADNPLIGTPHKVSGHNRLENVVVLDWGMCFLPVIGLCKSEAVRLRTLQCNTQISNIIKYY